MAADIGGPRHPLSTTKVAFHTAPTGFTSFFKFLTKRRQAKKLGHPRQELSYAEGVAIVKTFLQYASTHTLAELQAFTAMRVPTPRWVSKQIVKVPDFAVDRAAKLLWQQLSVDPKGAERVGGATWWQLRGRDLTAEWVEMKNQRQWRQNQPRDEHRILLYFHGGAHYFSSLETHRWATNGFEALSAHPEPIHQNRYQIQRHARKLNAKAFAVNLRLAPQYPFPCALHDALASYLYLISPQGGNFKPAQILVAGDSAGGGLALSLLVLLRDSGIALPAGAILISPWVDLAHSFPSISGDDSGDYIPSKGFHYRPGLEWPPCIDEQNVFTTTLVGEQDPIGLPEQMQMYCSNALLNHPLVSPINQGSLGGLPPLYIAAGSAELLRDEIVYLAHKISRPHDYAPSDQVFQDYPSQKRHFEQSYDRTRVQLQVFDYGCHVATTLSITALAKFQYRGAANFGLWALSAAKKRDERIISEAKHQRDNHDGDREDLNFPKSPKSGSSSLSSSKTSFKHGLPRTMPKIESTDFEKANEQEHSQSYQSDEDENGSDEDDDDDRATTTSGINTDTSTGNGATTTSSNVIKVTGHLPSFGPDRFLRQRVSIKGQIRPLEPVDQLQACQIDRNDIGQLHSKPVRKWLDERMKFDEKFSNDLKKFRTIRINDRTLARENGFLKGKFRGENPPLCSVAGWFDERLALKCAESVDVVPKDKSFALTSWAKISSGPDEEVVGNKSANVDEVDRKMEGLNVTSTDEPT
ncbi:hypothetical protein OIV83_005342 [Microbotryomycetes sp. JL201]|nr:hypothetical protein OIV83_005342 [Microbotryomycetes sp. JL201]